MNAVSEKSTEGYEISCRHIPGIGWTRFGASSAVVTLTFFHFDLSVFQFDRIGAARFYTHTTLDTGILFPFYDRGTFHSDIVFLGLQTVILASGDTKFEFMRKLSCKISLVQFLSDIVGINVSTWTDLISLTGCDSTYTWAADTRLTIAFLQFCFHFIDLIQFDKWDLYALSGCQMYMSVSIFFCHFRNLSQLLCCQISSYHCQSQGKVIFLFLAHESAFFQCSIIYCHNSLPPYFFSIAYLKSSMIS